MKDLRRALLSALLRVVMQWRVLLRACGAALVSLVVPGFSRAFSLVERRDGRS